MANPLAPVPSSSSGQKPAAPSGNMQAVRQFAAGLEKKLENAQARARTMRENAEGSIEAGVTVLEVQSANAIGCAAEGYFGEDKMDLGSLDMRTLLGLGLASKGLLDTMSGENGMHELALGNGFMAAGLGRMARNAGRKLRESYDRDKAPAAASAAASEAPASNPALAQQPLPQGEGWADYERLGREIVVSGDDDEDEQPRRSGRGGRRQRRGGQRPQRQAANNAWTQVSMAG